MMEYNIYKFHFKDKEYLVVSLNEQIPNAPEFIESMNDNLSDVFGDDAGDIIFFPTKVNFYGFENINSKTKKVEDGS